MGATGAVGEVLLRTLEERALPLSELILLASERSVGVRIPFRGEELEVRHAGPEAFVGVDLVFFAATGGLSRELAPAAVARGAVVIDKSATWRLDPTVPLVVPEVNAAALAGSRGIVACPNCTTIAAVMALEPLRRAAGLRRVVATTLQAVSGSGKEGIEELASQERILDDLSLAKPRVYVAPIARNAVPQCGAVGEDGTTSEERKLLDETRKILGEPQLEVAATCVRVPVMVGHSISLLVETARPLSALEATEALAAFPGVCVVNDEPAPPTPLDAVGRDEVLVGRIRENPAGEGLLLWVVSDNLRKGAATNAVQIAEAMLAS